MPRKPATPAFFAVEINGQGYVRCVRCKGWGREGWTHACKSSKGPGRPHGNWYPSPAQLESVLSWNPRQRSM